MCRYEGSYGGFVVGYGPAHFGNFSEVIEDLIQIRRVHFFNFHGLFVHFKFKMECGGGDRLVGMSNLGPPRQGVCVIF